MKKLLTILTALFGLMSCSGGNNQTAFPEDSLSFGTPSGKTLRVACIFHGSLAFEYDGNVIQVDPVTRMGDMKIDYSAFGKADAIFITHSHHDHLCQEAIDTLSGEKTALYANAESVSVIGRGKVLANGDSGELSGGVSYTAVPAYNTTPGKEKYQPKGRDNGFILTIDGFRVYISGDTEDIPEMRNIKNIDVAFLSTNQPFTMTPEQIVRAAKLIKPKVLFPYHYSDTPIQKVADLLKGTGIDVRIRNYQ